MKIDGITCCVGPMYAAQLSRSLPRWIDTLDTLTIVTKPDDADVLALGGYDNLRIVTTDVFTQYGAHFNKGAALNIAFAAADPSDWCLHFDSDIIPPPDWRSIAEQTAQPLCLSGAFRYSEAGECLDEAPLYPYGYFHLWHTHCPKAWRWPLFETWHAHAGSYDANFTDLWPPQWRQDLGFKLVHQGERRTNWFGPGADRNLMAGLMQIGLRKLRMRSNRGVGRLPIPEPQLRLLFANNWFPSDIEWGLKALRICRQAGPFAVEARVQLATPAGFETITSEIPLTEIEQRVLACMK